MCKLLQTERCCCTANAHQLGRPSLCLHWARPVACAYLLPAAAITPVPACRYGAEQGTPALREAICKRLYEKVGRKPNEVRREAWLLAVVVLRLSAVVAQDAAAVAVFEHVVVSAGLAPCYIERPDGPL